MLEYLSFKKHKKQKEEKEKKKGQEGTKLEAETPQSGSSSKPGMPVLLEPAPDGAPVLDPEDEFFFERLTSGNVSVDELDDQDESGAKPPPLPPRMKTPDLSWDSDSESFVKAPAPAAADGEKDKNGKVDERKKGTGSPASQISRGISLLVQRSKSTINNRRKKKAEGEVKPTNLVVPEHEADKERDDLSRVLDDLNLSARNNRAFSLGDESAELVRKFTLVLKDLINGVPTAVDDLRSLLDDPDGTLAKSFEKLPNSLKKLVTQLPHQAHGHAGPRDPGRRRRVAGPQARGQLQCRHQEHGQVAVSPEEHRRAGHQAQRHYRHA